MAKAKARSRPLLRQALTNFAAGELSPELAMRVDVKAYANGASSLLNVALHASGAATRRPGTWLVGRVDHPSRLAAFEFDADERYLLLFQPGQVEIRDSAGAWLTTVTGATWTEAQLPELQFAQKGDAMVIVHRDLHPLVLWRTGLSSFSLAAVVFATDHDGNKGVPFFKYADDAVTLRVSVTSGSGTATASANVFSAAHVNTRLRWHGVQLAVTGYTSPTQVSVTVIGSLRGKLVNNPYRTQNGSATVRVSHPKHGFSNGASVTFSGSAAVGGLLPANLDGTRTITYVSEDEYDITAGASATSAVDGGGSLVYFSGANLPTREWLEQAISADAGWPGAVCFHEGRLCFGGSWSQPDGLWLSRLESYFDFAVGEGAAADSIQATIGADRVASIRHLVSNRDLIVLTSAGEFAVPRGSQDKPLTPDSFRLVRQTQYGASLVRPALLDGAVLYVQQTGKAVREFLYDDSVQAYGSNNLSLLTEHLIDQPVALAALPGTRTRPEQYGFAVNADGSIAALHSARAEGQAGWMRWRPRDGDAWTDAVVLDDRLWLLSLRGGVRWLERLADDDGLTVDCAQQHSGAAATVWALDPAWSPYAGETVHVVDDGGWHLGSVTVAADGTLTLPSASAGFVVGFDYDWQLRTMPVVPQLSAGPVIGQPMRFARVILGLDETVDVTVQGQRLVLRGVADEVGTPPPKAGGRDGARGPRRAFRLLGWTRDGVIELGQDAPMPVRVLGLLVEVLV